MIVELLGPIGAGKSTYLSALMQHCSSGRNPPILDIEDEETLHCFVLPLLKKVYSRVDVRDHESEFKVEALFALIRALSIKAAMLTPPDDTPQPKHTDSTAAVTELGRNPRLTTLLHTAGDLAVKFRLTRALGSGDYDRLVSLCEKIADRHNSSAEITFVDRGCVDVLCFILERITTFGIGKRDVSVMVCLFCSLLGFLLTEVCHRPPGCGSLRGHATWSKKTDYFVLHKNTPLPTCEERIEKRGRPEEVDSRGKALARVIAVNCEIDAIYQSICAPTPAVATFTHLREKIEQHGLEETLTSRTEKAPGHGLTEVLHCLEEQLCRTLDAASMSEVVQRFGVSEEETLGRDRSATAARDEFIGSLTRYAGDGTAPLLDAILRRYDC